MSQPFHVVQPQVHTNDEPIRFQVGDSLQVGRQDPDDPTWFWVVGPGGRSGWVFRAYLSGDSGTVTGLRAYDATELDVEAGEHGGALEYADGWWLCQLSDGRRGWIRASHLELL